jgi:hypothetical protein
MNRRIARYKLSIQNEVKDDHNGFVIIMVIREGEHSHVGKKTQIRGKRFNKY